MDVGTFCAQSHVLVVAGKGGVGKTTMTRGPRPHGRRRRQVGPDRRARGQVGDHGRLRPPRGPRLRGSAARARPGRELPGSARGSVRARRLTPDDALMEYLEDHGLRRVSKRLARSGVLDVVSTAIPGIRDVLGAGQGQAARARGRGRPDPGRRPGHRPRDHVPDLGRAAWSAQPGAGPLRTQAQDVVELLSDPDPVPGGPGDPARGAAGLRDDRVGLHPGGQGGRAARPGHRQRAATPSPRVWTGRPRRRPRRRGRGRPGAGTWRPSRRRGASAWRRHAVSSGADRATGPRAAAPPPARAGARRRRRSARPRPSGWPAPRPTG